MSLQRDPAAVHPAGRHSALAGTSGRLPLRTGNEKPGAAAVPPPATSRSSSGFAQESVVSLVPRCPAGWMPFTIRIAPVTVNFCSKMLGDVVLRVDLLDRGL